VVFCVGEGGKDFASNKQVQGALFVQSHEEQQMFAGTQPRAQCQQQIIVVVLDSLPHIFRMTTLIGNMSS
jgi:hypothetical protein